MSKYNDYDFDSENYLYDDENKDNLDNSDSHKFSNNEDISEKPTIERIFNTEDMLYAVEKNLRGYQRIDNQWVYKSEPIVRDQFISYTINSLRSVVSNAAIISALTEKEAKELLYEKNIEFIDAAEDELTLDEDHFEYVVNLHDTVLQIFMGILIGGQGSKVLRQVAASLYVDDREKQNSSFINYDFFKDKSLNRNTSK